MRGVEPPATPYDGVAAPCNTGICWGGIRLRSPLSGSPRTTRTSVTWFRAKRPTAKRQENRSRAGDSNTPATASSPNAAATLAPELADPPGLEPGTLRLTGGRTYHLCYRPIAFRVPCTSRNPSPLASVMGVPPLDGPPGIPLESSQGCAILGCQGTQTT